MPRITLVECDAPKPHSATIDGMVTIDEQSWDVCDDHLRAVVVAVGSVYAVQFLAALDARANPPPPPDPEPDAYELVVEPTERQAKAGDLVAVKVEASRLTGAREKIGLELVLPDGWHGTIMPAIMTDDSAVGFVGVPEDATKGAYTVVVRAAALSGATKVALLITVT